VRVGSVWDQVQIGLVKIDMLAQSPYGSAFP
jgi:hypothetical protein